MTVGKTDKEATTSFYEALVTPGYKIKKYKGTWLVGVFKGLRAAAGHSNKQVEELQRIKRMGSSDDHEHGAALRSEAAAARAN
eukprot:1607074-Alexandrium_andersonii.AAC.1